MNFLNRVTALVLLSSGLLFSACANTQSPESTEVGFYELYVQYDLNTQTGEIILYDLSVPKSLSETQAMDLSADLLAFAEENKLSSHYFQATHLKATEEGFYDDSTDKVKVRIPFVTEEVDPVLLFDDIFNKIARLPSKTYRDSDHPELILTYFSWNNGIKYINYNEENNIQIHTKPIDSEYNEYLVTWDSNKPKIEFGLQGIYQDDFESIYPYFLKQFSLESES